MKSLFIVTNILLLLLWLSSCTHKPRNMSNINNNTNIVNNSNSNTATTNTNVWNVVKNTASNNAISWTSKDEDQIIKELWLDKLLK